MGNTKISARPPCPQSPAPSRHHLPSRTPFGVWVCRWCDQKLDACPDGIIARALWRVVNDWWGPRPSA